MVIARHVAAVAGAVEPARAGQHLHLVGGDEVAAMRGGDDDFGRINEPPQNCALALFVSDAIRSPT